MSDYVAERELQDEIEQLRGEPSLEQLASLVDRLITSSEDSQINGIIREKLPELLPMASRLNSLTFLTKKDVELRRLDLKIIGVLRHIFTNEYQYKHKEYINFVSILHFLDNKILDSLNGWKFSKLTTPTRKLEISTVEKKRRWI